MACFCYEKRVPSHLSGNSILVFQQRSKDRKRLQSESNNLIQSVHIPRLKLQVCIYHGKNSPDWEKVPVGPFSSINAMATPDLAPSSGVKGA